MTGLTVTPQPNGKVKITYNLATLWITDAEAEAAATDPVAAAALWKRVRAMR